MNVPAIGGNGPPEDADGAADGRVRGDHEPEAQGPDPLRRLTCDNEQPHGEQRGRHPQPGREPDHRPDRRADA